ncbi:autotransporter assembly complex protein TamA [Hydrogenophaga sp. PBL-H3]|uniref:autotransporter assembly complex protein TamA n=1 Tax=Hydrogenophaga sp. PBL-H3 TaxID=434010 RepID=UPI00131FB965|nr:BamA/TamA family outer membrane protein [Hydrogenophaga sp. PBL-H3]QHE75285.1 BamA/TamA family outer membrane protein [Hydrogenophaga sp. PBL-H3]QHE79712.1 BamA/TamA family outer membrane protein [Hydrogenophaga sp. PBL-H3]
MKCPAPDPARWAGSLLLCMAALWPLVQPQVAWAQAVQAPVAQPADASDEPADADAAVPRGRTTPRAPAAPRFEIDLQAPDEVREFLLRHIELQRFRLLRNLDANELTRLLAAAPANLRELLATLGHFSPLVEVIGPPALPQAADTAASNDTTSSRPMGTVTIRVSPGPITQVATVNVSFVGDIATAPEAADQREAIQYEARRIQGLPFSQSDWDRTKDAALRALIARRYPAGRVQNSLADIDADQRQANLYIELDSGPAMRMGEVVVDGAQRYEKTTVERLVRLSGVVPGSDYDLAQLQAAQQRLIESGYYDSAFVFVEPSMDGETLPVKVQLRESLRQKLVLGVGGSTDSGARLSIEHTHHSLPGIGWRAVSALKLERVDQLASTDWSSPPSNDGWRWIAGGRLLREQDDFNITTSQRLRAGQSQDGIEYDRSFYLQYDRASVFNEATQTLRTAEANSSITANYAWTRRRFDDPISPNAGHGLAVELGVGYTLGSTRLPFARTQARWLGYWPLGGLAPPPEPKPGEARVVNTPGNRTSLGRLALRLEGGAVLAKRSAAIPDTQLFLTGGDATVRGYGLRDIGVRQSDGSVLPGRYKGVVSLEWQRPIFNANGRSPVESVLFIDGGAVANRAGDLKPLWGVGTGVRYNSPVGPLQLDLGYGLETRRWRLHLNVGFTF